MDEVDNMILALIRIVFEDQFSIVKERLKATILKVMRENEAMYGVGV